MQNGRNIVGQKLPTLLDVTCCVRLHNLLHVVACCCAKFETGQTFQPTTPNIFLFRYRRSVAQQRWIRLHSSSNILGPRTLITHGLHRRMGCILPTMHCRSQTCWELLLHPFAHHCQHTRNNSQHCWCNNVGSCCFRLYAALDRLRLPCHINFII